MHNRIVLLVLFSLISCTKKEKDIENIVPQSPQVNTTVTTATTVTTGPALGRGDQKIRIDDNFLEYLRFAGSVEKEIFKIVDPKFKKTQKIPSQLMILSQLLDVKAKKKMFSGKTAIFYNCYKIETQNKSEKEIEISRVCEKPAKVIARVVKNDPNIYDINFIQSEWQSVIGDSAILNQKDKICRIVISNKKVFEVSCHDTLITIGAGAELEEIKLHRFIFDRAAKNQIVISGGRFKDFVERSKINITVPEEGKIKFDEEELAVRDDFQEEPKKPSAPVKDSVPPPPPGLNPLPLNELDMNNPPVDGDKDPQPHTGR